jgi:hypothetical protein
MGGRNARLAANGETIVAFALGSEWTMRAMYVFSNNATKMGEPGAQRTRRRACAFTATEGCDFHAVA